MAKQDEANALNSIFAKTEKPQKEETKKDLIKPTTFGIAQSEREALQEIADKSGVARNAVGRYAIQYFLKQYAAGKTELKTQKVTKIKAP